MVLAFQLGGIDLPIDYEHQNDKPEAKLSGPVPAAGWIKELKAAAGGLWGRVEWTATAAEMIGRKEYRYLSPSILFHPKTRQIMLLKGAGLVHNPNLYLTALASQETPMLPPNKPQSPEAANLAAELAKLLQLPADTPVQDMLSDRRSERATLSAGRATEKVNAAVRQGYITNGMRDWALSLCASDETAFDSFLEKAGPTFAYLSQTTHAAQLYTGQTQARVGSDMEAAVCTQLGLKPGSLAS